MSDSEEKTSSKLKRKRDERGQQCFAYGCKKRYKFEKPGEPLVRSDSSGSSDEESPAKRKGKRSFHKFPPDQKRKAQWIQNCKRADATPSPGTKICSDHFLEKYLNRSATGGNTLLRKGAIPTRFKKFPKHLQKKTVERRPLVRLNPATSNKPVESDKTVTEEVQVESAPLDAQPQLCEPDPPALATKLTESPRTLKKELHRKNALLTNTRKRLKLSQQKTRRLKKKVLTLESLLRELREKDLLSRNAEEMLEQSFSAESKALFKRIINKRGLGKGFAYSPELKSFALTLQFYSAKAYEFVRKKLNKALPHQSVIRKWYGSIPADPGFTEPAFIVLKEKVAEVIAEGKQLHVALMLDEMSIRKFTSWDGTKFRGYVDMGAGAEDDDSAPLAKDALVFMVVSLTFCWKVPCAYFLIDGLTGKEKANLVTICVKRLHDIGVKVVSLTCDGPASHFTMLRELGAGMEVSDLQPYFPHPLDKGTVIYVFIDVCHMLKLVRNTIGEREILFDGEGNRILWRYIVSLQELQDKEGLRLANKFRLAHISWRQQKMKVKLAAQSISSSVADAIEYCNLVLKLRQFEGSEATVKFLRVFDRLFDTLNSRSCQGKGYKAPLSIDNKSYWEPFLNDAAAYIKSLKDFDGRPIYEGKRRTGFVGFLVCIESAKSIFENLVKKERSLTFILMYKFSQDHLELLFAAVRSAGGFNNNPTTQQFIAAYKRLFLRSAIAGTNGNAEKRDSTYILQLSSSSYKSKKSVSLSDISLMRKYDLDCYPCSGDEDDDDFAKDVPHLDEYDLTDYKQAAVSYIAGFAAKMATKKLNCKLCEDALGSVFHQHESKFLAFKDRGGLFKPSESVVFICEETEKCFQRMLKSTNGKLPRQAGLADAIPSAVLKSVRFSRVFAELDEHMMQCAFEDNHVFNLIKLISSCYSKVRFHHLASEKSGKITGTKIRRKLNKLILFNNQ